MSTVLSSHAIETLRVIAKHKGQATTGFIGFTLFPIVRKPNGVRLSGPKNAQGAALAVCRYTAQLRRAGLIRREVYSNCWQITNAGQIKLEELDRKKS